MKAIIVRLLVLTIVLGHVGFSNTLAQHRQLSAWPIGYGSSSSNPEFGGVMIDFSSNVVELNQFDIDGILFGQSALAETTGDVALYTDGCRIYDSSHNIISGGDSINYTPLWRYCPDGGYLTLQGQLFLPWPGDPDRAALFHIRVDDDRTYMDLLWTIVKKGIDEWLVESKNISIYRLEFPSQYISASRHANGRDWWLILPNAMSNDFVTMHLNPKGIQNFFVQSVGREWGRHVSGGQVTFSFDGSKFIRIAPLYGLDIYDFDRCSGILTNPVHGAPLSTVAGGCAVSADSRFLYVPNAQDLYQYDLKAKNILSSREHIGRYDGFVDPFPTTFFQAALSPNGKIYITATNGVRSMHVIHHPERKGKACDFRQHDLRLPVHILFTAPNFPNYQLGPLDGSPCDTLGINNVPVAEFRYEFDTLDERLMHFRNTSAFEPTNFHWTYGDGHASQAFEKSHLYYKSDTYHVCLTASNKYGSDTFCRDIPVQLSQEYDPADLPEFIIAPNPVRDYLRISFNSALASDIDFEIFDVKGRLVRTETLMKNTLDHFIDLSSLTAGLFLYRIEMNDGRLYTGKLIKTHS